MAGGVRFAVRQMLRSPGYALAVIVTLALGIGVNTAVFSMVDGFLLRRLPYPQPDRLAALVTHLEGTDRGGHWSKEDDSHGVHDWLMAKQHISAATVAAYEGQMGSTASGVNLAAETGSGHVARFVTATAVTSHFFSVLGLEPLIGREFSNAESRPGGARAVVLSYGLWQSLFAGDSAVLGRTVRLKGEPFTVIGVLPAAATMPHGNSELYTVLQPGDAQGACAGYDCGILMRLKPGATWDEVRGELAHLPVHPDTDSTPSGAWLYAQPMQNSLNDDSSRPKVLVLMLAVSLILLIACANLAGLTMARIGGRTQELATRMALGASRWRLLRQLWLESLLPAALGAAASMGLASACLRAVSSVLPATMQPLGGFAIDGRVLLFTLAATLATTVLFGALPALVARRVALRSAMSAKSYSVAAGTGRSRRLLIAGEVALTVVLVAAAGVLVRTLVYLETLPPGFDAHNVTLGKVSLDEARYHSPAAFTNLLAHSLAATRRIPGVENVAAGLSVPYERGLNWGAQIADGPHAGERISTSTSWVTPDYFATLRVPILAGREVKDSDTAPSEPVAVVNEAFARKYFGTANAVGRFLTKPQSAAQQPPMRMRIVGVVGDVTKEQGIAWTAPLGTEPVLYLPAAQFPAAMLAPVHLWFEPSLIVRTRGPVANLGQSMAAVLAGVDRDLSFSGFYRFEDLMETELAMQRIEVLLLGSLALLALLLSAVGVGSLVAAAIVERRREIGIRIALGATIGDSVRTMLRSGLTPVLVGAGVGLAACFAVLRLLRSEIYGVGPYDLWTLAATPALLFALSLLAALVPAQRITRIDPAETLRAE
ncbi:ADOP family duplicated permease [Silvibacterium sp.]|uniref:ADOP family duplicated permease n=1 Tax=Silvibacterium sp. TaxID=1964179 RepID=UPI0039E2BEBA